MNNNSISTEEAKALRESFAEQEAHKARKERLKAMSTTSKPKTAIEVLQGYQRIGDNMPKNFVRMGSPLINDLCNQIERAEAVIFQAKQLMNRSEAA